MFAKQTSPIKLFLNTLMHNVPTGHYPHIGIQKRILILTVLSHAKGAT